MKKTIIVILTTIVILTIYFFSLTDADKRYLIFEKLGFDRPFTHFYVRDMSLNKDRLIYDEDITIWGYLVKDNNSFMLIESELFENIHFLKQPNLVYLIDKNTSLDSENSISRLINNSIDDHCIGHYVKAHGKLVKFNERQTAYTLQVGIIFGFEKDFSFACTPTYTNGKLDKPEWND
jgi:hypothetical protein